MDTLAQRSELLVDLRDAGQAFLSACRGESNDQAHDDENYRICRLVTDENLKDMGHTIIAELVDIPARPDQASLLSEPVFRWNGSTRDPVVTKAGNKIVNTSECFPPALTLLALDYVDKGYGEGNTVYDQFVRKVGALFFCEATPRDFQVDASRQGVGLYFRDPDQPTIETDDYIVKSSLFFDQMKNGNLPGLDIHDIAHHASQMGIYGDFYKWFAAHATEDVLTNADTVRQKMLLNLMLNTSIEHSVVQAEDGVQSFGCLNWQSPRKSILKSGVSNRAEFRINDYPYGAKDFNQWSAIRAIASIYRGQIEAEQVLATNLNWMNAMGYDMDTDLLRIVRPFESYDYSIYPYDTASKAMLTVPETPEELFDNCRQLIAAEFRGIDAAVQA